MARQTNYEVHVMQAGKWQIHARFNAMQKDAAIEEAKTLDQQPGIGKVKVIKEVYNPEEGLSDEYIIYKSSDRKGGGADDDPFVSGGGSDPFADKDPFGSGSGGGGKKKYRGFGGGKSADDFDFDLDGLDFEDEDEKPKKKKKKKKKVATKKPAGQPASAPVVLIKLLLILLFSISISAMITFIAGWAIGETALQRILGGYVDPILFVLFVVVFLATSIPMAAKFMGKDTLANRRRSPKARAAKPAKAAPQAPVQQASKTEEKLGDIDLTEIMQAHEEAVGEAQEETPEVPEEIAEQAEEAEAEQPQEAEAASDETPLTPHAELQRTYVRGFSDKLIAAIGTPIETMDTFNKFGLNLFMAGATEAVAKVRDVDADGQKAILAGMVERFGFKKEHAEGFAEKYGEYLTQDARYMQIYQAGRNAMNTFFTDEASATGHLKSAIEEWNKPKQKEESVVPVTVMFTDMVGSTNLTQTRGDAVAQEVVRAHNRIVRQALTDFKGKEVKHTGDGIMASFPSASNAVEAGVQMQRGVLQHNKDYPDLPLHIKIGINAGEPIAEDNDLFGTTVQLSARITDKASSEEIFVSEIVRGICAGKPLKFESKGQFDLKGVSEPVTLYSVLWMSDEDRKLLQAVQAQAQAQAS